MVHHCSTYQALRNGLLLITTLLMPATPLLAWPAVQGITILREEQELSAQDGSASDELGFSVAIHSRVVVAGAYAEDNTRGAAYVFQQHGPRWKEVAKLVPGDVAPLDFFGSSVAVGGETVLGGAPKVIGRGAAYVFSRTAGAWAEVQKLESSHPSNGDQFGFAVAVDEDTVLVGAIGDDDACGGGSICESGGAYVFVRVGGSWQQEQRLTASDMEENAWFGWSLALQGDRAVVGAPGVYGGGYNGAVYVFERSGGIWAEKTKLEASDGDAGDQFGHSVALNGDTILVGAPSDESDVGSAYVFEETGAGWVQRQKVVLGATSAFGFSVALSGDSAVIGSSQQAYLISLVGGSFLRLADLRPVGWPIPAFGQSVGLDRDRAIIGATGGDRGCPGVIGCNSGSAYLFRIRELGTTYCRPAQPNSTGTFGRVGVFGSDVVAESALMLTASDLPQTANIGYFIMGTGMSTSTPPGSAGPLCVAPGLKRYFPAASTDEYPGGFTRKVGTHGPVSHHIAPGSTWSFQAWYRDADAGISNLTDAVSVSFQ